MSIAVCVKNEEEMQLVEKFIENSAFSSRFQITVMEDFSGHYPINKLRNAAINQVKTSHFFLTDIDLWPACR